MHSLFRKSFSAVPPKSAALVLVVLFATVPVRAQLVATRSTPQNLSKNSSQESTAPANSADPSDPHGYRIGSGDILQINVWKEPDASVASVIVRPDGFISLPLIKEVQVAGLSPRQAEKLISEKLTRFIRESDVTVLIKEVKSKKVYVVGAVNKTGPINLDHPMNVLQALAEAGGLNEFAKRSRIYVLRSEAGQQTRLAFNYNAVIKGEHMEQNRDLLPGDTLIVPQ